MELVAHDLKRAEGLLAERGGSLGRPLRMLATTTSTNDEAKRGAQDGALHGTTWVAEEQSAGRGRQGRTWMAARGESLLFSVLLRLDCAPSRLPMVSILTGLVVRDAVARAAPRAQVGLKWPNDVVATHTEGTLEQQKVAGVLLETITSGREVKAVVVGVGINIHSRHFPPDIASRATSVALLASDPPDRAEILVDVLAGLDRDLHVVLTRGLGMVRARLDAVDALRGRPVHNAVQAGQAGQASQASQGSDLAGMATGIDDEGRLVVRLTSGEVTRWNAGEVHLART